MQSEREKLEKLARKQKTIIRKTRREYPEIARQAGRNVQAIEKQIRTVANSVSK